MKLIPKNHFFLTVILVLCLGLPRAAHPSPDEKQTDLITVYKKDSNSQELTESIHAQFSINHQFTYFHALNGSSYRIDNKQLSAMLTHIHDTEGLKYTLFNKGNKLFDTQKARMRREPEIRDRPQPPKNPKKQKKDRKKHLPSIHIGLIDTGLKTDDPYISQYRQVRIRLNRTGFVIATPHESPPFDHASFMVRSLMYHNPILSNATLYDIRVVERNGTVFMNSLLAGVDWLLESAPPALHLGLCTLRNFVLPKRAPFVFMWKQAMQNAADSGTMMITSMPVNRSDARVSFRSFTESTNNMSAEEFQNSRRVTSGLLRTVRSSYKLYQSKGAHDIFPATPK